MDRIAKLVSTGLLSLGLAFAASSLARAQDAMPAPDTTPKANTMQSQTMKPNAMPGDAMKADTMKKPMKPMAGKKMAKKKMKKPHKAMKAM